ncbi:hypothetical protein PWEIH_02212 [Listeria weihenstephanensis FSL R9-0317]|uniref:DUF3958 domain-containing protein n=1 Tax=Listeria weihenstephanensis TaxID=1006155 RepID=A0A1S7FQW9_9LIST|nr:DUF3958 family protein [Listeria weihenstephanensis]AQY49782.1 hypothetical protein UE46_01030 [Listeria weihenstephanensis]EUJ41084.1 hypothetical protein PWEIH_02212 [Listeria weihenstephanensis FSL R9-0317]
MNDRDREIDSWNQRLRNVADDQYAKEREIRRQKQLLDEVDYVHNRNNRLFHELGSTWHRDREMAVFLDTQRYEYQRQHFHVVDGMEEEQTRMEREKRALMDKESDYYAARRKVEFGGEQA